MKYLLLLIALIELTASVLGYPAVTLLWMSLVKILIYLILM